MIPVCPICGKRFIAANWPTLWGYRRGPNDYCSEQCMNVSINRDYKVLNKVLAKKRKGIIMKGKITLEMKKKAVEMAISGQSPLEYLRECGSKNPSATWLYIRQTLEKNDPEKFAQLPERLPKTAAEAMEGMKEAADKFFGVCADMGLKGIQTETPEQPTIKLDGAITIQAKDVGAVTVETPEGEFTDFGKAVREPRYTVTAIRYPEIGEFYFDKKYNEIDWRTPEGDEIGMSPTGWRILMKDMPEILKVLGVEL